MERLQEEISALDIFDAEAWLGKTSFFPLMDEGTPDLLAGLQKRHGIKGALVSHWFLKKYSALESNQYLLKQIAGRPDWQAVITALPLFPEDPWLIDSRQVKAVRVYPETFRFPLVDWCAGSLCAMLVEKAMPLFVFHTETAFRDIHAIAKKFPELKIIVESQTKKIIYHARTALALMKECPNVRLEISNWYSPGLLEYAAQHIGGHRLIFGSFMPANDPLVTIGLLLNSKLSVADKKKIAGGNIRRIISEVKK